MFWNTPDMSNASRKIKTKEINFVKIIVTEITLFRTHNIAFTSSLVKQYNFTKKQ